MSTKPILQLPSVALANKIDYVDVAENTRSTGQQASTQTVHAFRINNLGLLLAVNETSELLDHLSICRLPNTNSTLYGMGNLRGNIIPVFDLQHLFGMPKEQNKYFLVIGAGEEAVAVLLNQLPQQIVLGEQDRLNNLPPMPASLRPFAKAAYQVDGIWFDCNLFDFFHSLRGVLQ